MRETERLAGALMRVALDTNTYKAFTEGEKRAVDVVRFADTLGMPVPVMAELHYGFLAGGRGRQNEAWLLKFLDSPRVKVLACDEQTAAHFAELKFQLKRQGTPIPINDVWIAALALQHRMALFTFDSDFDRIPQLARI